MLLPASDGKLSGVLHKMYMGHISLMILSKCAVKFVHYPYLIKENHMSSSHFLCYTIHYTMSYGKENSLTREDALYMASCCTDKEMQSCTLSSQAA